MIKTSLKQKIGLIGFGVFLGIILLEIGLRIGGFAYLYFQERANRISLEQKGEYVILCLGESTTQAGGQDSYPRQLEEVLNEEIPGIKFSVINKGVAGTNTTSIVSILEDNLDRYKPDIVITMMGINDPSYGMVTGNLSENEIKSFFENFQTYKFMQWLLDRIHHKIDRMSPSLEAGKEIKATKSVETILREGTTSKETKKLVESLDKDANPISSEADTIIEIGDRLRNQNKLDEAAEMYHKASSLDPEKCFWRYLDLAVLCHRRYQDNKRAEKYYFKALEINPNCDAPYVYGEQESGLAPLYREENNLTKAEEMAKKAVIINPENALAYSELGRINEKQGHIEIAIKMYEKCISLDPNYNSPFVKLAFLYRNTGRWKHLEKLCNKVIMVKPDDDRAYAALAACYQKQGKTQLAGEYLAKVEKLRASSYNRITVQNYRKLFEILKKRNIQLVCVQYPIRELYILKKMLPEDQGIIYVNNEKIFKKALEHSQYGDYFSDQFAGDFGHCTRRGNRLLAENIAETLLSTCLKNLYNLNPQTEHALR